MLIQFKNIFFCFFKTKIVYFLFRPTFKERTTFRPSCARTSFTRTRTRTRTRTGCRPSRPRPQNIPPWQPGEETGKEKLLRFGLKLIQYNGDLKSRHSGQFANGLCTYQILNGIWYPEVQPLEMRTYGCHFVKTHLKSRRKHRDFKWFGLALLSL